MVFATDALVRLGWRLSLCFPLSLSGRASAVKLFAYSVGSLPFSLRFQTDAVLRNAHTVQEKTVKTGKEILSHAVRVSCGVNRY